MTRKRLRSALWLLLIVPGLALAQLPVIDGASILKIIAETKQIINLYNTAVQTYNQIAYNAGWTPIKTPWLGIGTLPVNTTTATIFGETARWDPAVTAAQNIPGAWQTATYAINPPPFWAGYPLGQSTISADIASINIADGTSQAAMAAIANSRLNQPANDTALANLEQSAQDTSDGTNSEVEQLNQISNGVVLANRQQEDQNALLTSIAEQQIVMNKTVRDLTASNLNTMTDRDNYIADYPTQWGGSAATFAAYRQ